MKPLVLLTADQKVKEIGRLYFETSRITIQQDFAKAIDLLKTMNTEEERERAAVFLDGLAQMRSDWARERGGPKGRGQKTPPPKKK